MNIQEMTNDELIKKCIWLDQEQKKNRTQMNAYKGELQARGLALLDDRNTKYVKFYSDRGSAAIMDSMSLDILNPDKLRAAIGDGVYKAKITENTETKYKIDTKLEKALKAVFSGDYTFEITLEEFLNEMSIRPTVKQKGLLIKIGNCETR